MKPTRSVLLLLGIMLWLAQLRPAIAGPWTPCQPYRFGYPGTAHIFVNVWLKNDAGTQLGLPLSDLQRMMFESTAIWNEQSGAGITLRWAGLTTSLTTPGIVVWVKPNICNGSAMAAFPTLSGSNNSYNAGGTIEIHKYSYDAGLQDGACPTTLPWTVFPIPWVATAERDSAANTRDLVADMVHELGHQMGIAGHPGETVGTPPNTSIPCKATSYTLAATPYNQQSVMDADGLDLAGRSLRAWDKHRMAALYGHRGANSTLYNRFFFNTWSGVNVAIASPSRITHRPGASQGGSSIILEWFDRGTANVTRGFRKERWWGTFLAASLEFFTPNRLDHAETPGAVALDFINNRAIAVSQRSDPYTPRYASNSEYYQICYRLSTTGGATFGTETCIPNLGSRRYGVSAGFDPFTSRFIISFANDPNEQIVFATIPSIGGTLTYTTLQNNRSWHGASVACRGIANGCRFVYRDRDSNLIKWVEGGVDANGYISLLPLTRVAGYPTNEMPSVVYWDFDNTWRMAFRQGHGQLYSLKSDATATIWTATGDILNDWNTSASAPVLSTANSFLYAWYVKW